ncbi:MAG: hypothetical protein DHS20C21_14410 [Gemmatimonadota bacterium]|nr:MAG: hypothetical protein DHS20C21_14410 [Gemmatimonadota bacterium]
MSTDSEIRLHQSRWVRGILIVLGTISVGVGIVGIFLPLLPTTIFMLFAAACYARASERFYRRLLANRWCGPAIREWRQYKSVPRRAKRTALTMVVVTFTVTITFFLPSPLVRAIVFLVGVGVFSIVWRLPVREVPPALAAQPIGSGPRGG